MTTYRSKERQLPVPTLEVPKARIAREWLGAPARDDRLARFDL